jgi:serine/threonine protein kinase
VPYHPHRSGRSSHYALENINRVPDIKEENILLGLVDSSIVGQLDTKEIAASSLYKSVDGYNLYRSANFGIPTRFGRPILCDFSLARNGQVEHCHDIQPDPYRAPEVILEMPWGYAVDIWNVGVMVQDFLHVANSTKLMRASRSGTCLRTDACSMGLTPRLASMGTAFTLLV